VKGFATPVKKVTVALGKSLDVQTEDNNVNVIEFAGPLKETV
jgi:hypothetical protein